MRRIVTLSGLLIAAVVIPQPAFTEDSLSVEALRVLERRCLSCHNDLDQEGDLSLVTGDQILDAGLVDPGSPEDSHLLTAVSSPSVDSSAI